MDKDIFDKFNIKKESSTNELHLSKININTDKTHPFPYNVPAIKYAKNLEFNKNVTFIVGDNGIGKSTLIESVAHKLNLPLIDIHKKYDGDGFVSSRILDQYLELELNIDYPRGFFFRAEDFGDYLGSVDRTHTMISDEMGDMTDNVPSSFFNNFVDGLNYKKNQQKRNYGEYLQQFSHGEAFLEIMKSRISSTGIYIFDEPEAPLSPERQLSLMYLIWKHLQTHNSQFIISTHSPILMAYPDAQILEVSDDGIETKQLDDIKNYYITKTFLNNPELYLKELFKKD